ncbi:MAG: hypothetical protein N2C14_03270 [Planctomycetales bacterium]
MRRNVIHLSLIAMLVGCPLWCGEEQACDGAVCDDVACDIATESAVSAPSACNCCKHQPDSPADSHNSSPTPCDDSSCELCHCICRGAVTEDNDSDAARPDVNPLDGCVLSANFVADSFQPQVAQANSQDLGRAISAGRLRALRMSWLI